MQCLIAQSHWDIFKDGVVMFFRGLELAAMATHSRPPVMVGAKPQVSHSRD